MTHHLSNVSNNNIYPKRLLLTALLTIGLVISGLPFVLAEQLPPAGAKVMAPSEIEELVSGQTEDWSEESSSSAGYYSPDGILLGVVSGSKIIGTWWVEDTDGYLCTEVLEWGGETCWQYWRDDLHVYVKWEGDFWKADFKEGNHLGEHHLRIPDVLDVY